jgi:hypothetical protein
MRDRNNGEQFENRSSLRTHAQSGVSAGSVKCEVCGCFFPDYGQPLHRNYELKIVCSPDCGREENK